MKNDLRGMVSDKPFFTKLVRITVPLAFQSLMLALVAAADALMLGRVEQNIMAAVSLATQVQFVQNMAISTIVQAGAILGAQYWGKGDRKTIDKLFLIMLRMAGAVSVLFAAGCLFIPELLMRLFAHDQVLIDIGAGYLRIAGWSYLLTGFSQSYLTVMKVTGHERPSAIISSGAVVINILLNALLIFGLFGLPAMGARGAALATLISRVVELVWAVICSHRKTFVHPDWRHIFTPTPGLTGDYVRVAMPLLGAALLWGVGFTSYTAIMGNLGADAAAANSITSVIRDLFCCLCNGIASAAGIIVGNELGAGDLDRGKLYGHRLMIISYIIGFGSTILVLLVLPLVEGRMVLTDQAREYLHGMMIVMAIYMIGRCVNTVVINGVFAAGGDTMFDMYSLVVAMWLIAIPTALLGAFVFHWPVVVVYACTCLDEVGKIPWVMLHYRKYKWVRDLTKEQAA